MLASTAIYSFDTFEMLGDTWMRSIQTLRICKHIQIARIPMLTSLVTQIMKYSKVNRSKFNLARINFKSK